jgi:GntR family transcriptional repressor for pyruvate dehydrogenase complex
MQPERNDRLAALFGTVPAGRGSNAIARRIERAILSGELAVGERLPNERDLGRLFGVSRATLREALRILEADGLLEVRRGVTGGAFVSVPRTERAASALAALIRFRQATPAHFSEFRLAFEAENARLAAERATPEQVAAIAEAAAAVAACAHPDAAWEEFMDRDIDFHERVAEATANPIRVAVMLGVHGAFRQSSRAVGRLDTPAWRREQAAQLQEVARAIRLRRPRSAQRHMQRHILSNTAVAEAMWTRPSPGGEGGQA